MSETELSAQHAPSELWEHSRATAAQRTVLDDLRESEWSPEFELLMRNRLVMGGLRYGRMHRDSDWTAFDCAAKAKKSLDKFSFDGNREHLVDAAAYCLLAFEQPMTAVEYFKGIDRDSDDIEVVVDKPETVPPTLRDPSVPGAGDERTVDDLGQWQDLAEERDAAVSQVGLLRDLVHAIEQADACKKQLREAQERVRVLRDELKALGVLT